MKYLIFILLLTGCATKGKGFGAALMIKETKDGGRIKLIGTGTWLEKGSEEMAIAIMEKKCPENYDITETGLLEAEKVRLLTKNHYTSREKYMDFVCRSEFQ